MSMRVFVCRRSNMKPYRRGRVGRSSLHRFRGWIIALATVVSAAFASPRADADTILVGRVPLKDVVVQGVANGRVQYAVNNRRAERSVDDVRVLFDEAPSLAAAEIAIDEGRTEDALRGFERALSEVSAPWKSAWIHLRRSRTLDAEGRLAEAVEAWAAILIVDGDSWWANAAPVRPARSQPDVAQVDRALQALAAARDRHADAPMLRAAIDDLEQRVRSLRAGAGPAPVAASEVADGDESGPKVDDAPQRGQGQRLEAGGGAHANPPAGRPSQATAEPAGGRSPQPASSINAARVARLRSPLWPPESPDVLDEAILAERPARAREELERLGTALQANGGGGQTAVEREQRAIERLLHREGLVERLQENPRAAAVAFMRAAIFYPRTDWGVASLIEAGRVYRDDLADAVTANRLFRRALAQAKHAPAAEALAAWAKAELGEDNAPGP